MRIEWDNPFFRKENEKAPQGGKLRRLHFKTLALDATE